MKPAGTDQESRAVAAGPVLRTLLLLLSAAALLGTAACDGGPLRVLRRIEFVRTLFTVRDHTADFRTMRARFPVVPVPASSHPQALPAGPARDLPATFAFDGAVQDTAQFLQQTDATGLLIVKDGAVVFERYWRGNTPATQVIGWSLSKSFLSALVGIAVSDGAIGGIDEPVTKYVPALAGSAYDGVSIRAVLQMSSGARWSEDYSDPNSDVMRFGRALALGHSLDEFAATMVREHPPGTYHRYNSLDTQVLGMVLTAATHDSLAHYLATRLWEPLGMQDGAYYIADGRGREFAAGGLNATLRDYAKFGLLYAQQGAWGARQMVPAAWVHASVTPDAPQLMPGRRDSSDEVWGYGFQWWVPDLAGDFSGIGIFNQFLYVNPAEHLVIALTSANHTYGTGHGDDETTDHEAAHFALFKAIEAGLHAP